MRRVGARLRFEGPALVALTALAVVQLWPAAGAGRLPESLDLMLQYVPNAAYLQRSLGELRLPLWNPFLGAGMPFAADPGAGVWYVPNWLMLVTLPLYAAIRAGLWVHLLWAALGTYVFCRGALGTGRLAASVGAVAFAVTTWLPGLGGMPAVLTSVSWVPWVMALGERAARGGGRWIGALAVTGAMQAVCGWPAGAYLAWLGLGVYVPISGRSVRRLSRLGLAAVAAVLVAGLLLVPAIEFVGETNYAETRSVEEAGREGYLTLLSWLRPASGSGSLESSQLYVGVAAVLLAVVGGLEWRRPAAQGLVALAVLAMAIAVGTRTPVFGALYAWLPGFRIVYLPARLGILVAFAVAGLAALGVQRLGRRRLRAGEIALAAGLFAALAPLTVLQFWQSEGYDNFRRLLTNVGRFSGRPYLSHAQELQYVAFGVASVAVLALAATRRWRVAAPMMAGLLLTDVVIAQQLARPPAFDPVRWYAPAFETAQRLRGELGEERVVGAQWHGTRHFLTDFPRSADAGLLPPNLSLLVGVRDAQGYNPLLLRRAAMYFAEAHRLFRGHTRPDDHWLWLEDFKRSDLLDRLAVARVVVAEEATWRARSYRVLREHQLRTGGGAVANSLIDVPPPAGPARLHVITFLGEGTGSRTGEVVGEVTLVSTTGETRMQLRVGEHTAEWAYERPDVARAVQHRQAPIALETQLVDAVAGRFRVYEYRATFDVPLDGRLRSVEIAPRLPTGSNTTLNVAGVWLEDTGALPVGGERTLRNVEAQQRLSSSSGQVTWVRDEPESLEAKVVSATGTTVTLADAFYPGWVARVDGQVVPIRESEGPFRAVDVPAGRHTLTFGYEPVSLRLGLVASVLGVLLTVGLLVTPSWSTISRRWRRKTSRP